MLDLWGKLQRLPGPYPLLHHLVDAAGAAHVLWETHLAPGVRAWLAVHLGTTEEEAQRFVSFLAALHDVGKACPCFQDVWPQRPAAGYIRHEAAGYLSVPTLLGELIGLGDPFTESVAHRIGEVVGGHHGAFQPVDPQVVRRPERDARLGGAAWQSKRRELVDTLYSFFNPAVPAAFPRPVAAALTGLVILADWVASDTEWIKTSQWNAPVDLAARWAHTLATVGERVAGLRLGPPVLVSAVTTQMLIDQPPNSLQGSIEEEFRPSGAGLLVITASTGYGKTEAAFLAAHRIGKATNRPGIAMCLPTQATTNAMWGRGVEFEKRMSLSAGPVTMAHSMATFHEPYRSYCTDDVALEWLNQPKRPLLAGLSVVTVDQVLLAALATQHNTVRLWALTGKTLIVDEVHAAEPYLLALLGRVLSWCGYLGVPVILLSATLPGHIARQLTTAYLTGANPSLRPVVEAPTYPGWVWHSVEGQIRRPSAAAVTGMRTHSRRPARINHVRYLSGERKTVITGYAARAATEDGCVAVVCSTVETAQATAQHLRNTLADVPVTLLHSRLPHAQRSRIEAEVITRFGKRATRADHRPMCEVVLSTPMLLDHSLDVDFDVMISDLAPIALLLQRLGRCWRHDRGDGERPGWVPAPTLVVLDPRLEQMPPAWCAVYPEYELLATRQILGEHGPDLMVPDDVHHLVQAVHNLDLPPIDGEAATAWRKQRATTAQHRALAHLVATPPPHLVDDLARVTHPNVDDADAATRLGVETARVIPQYRAADGRLCLDAQHTVRFPRDRPSGQDYAALIDASVRCPAGWVRDLEPVPQRWGRHPLLRHARILPAPDHGDLHLHPDLGLINGDLDDGL